MNLQPIDSESQTAPPHHRHVVDEESASPHRPHVASTTSPEAPWTNYLANTYVETQGEDLVINRDSTSWRIDRNSFDIRKQATIEFDEFGGIFQNERFRNCVPGFPMVEEINIENEGEEMAGKGGTEKLPDDEVRKGSVCCLPWYNLAFNTVSALGVVYGDICVSPLCTLQAVFSSTPATKDNVVGAISTMFWLMNIVVTLKYVSIMIRVDNNGEGGIMALTALASRSTHSLSRPWWKTITIFSGMFGASCFFGDSIVTPAISVMSAVEGLAVATPAFIGKTMPIALVLLLALFSIQRFGTGTVGRYFGPIIFVWCFTIGVMGVQQIIQEPSILAALNPAHAVAFLQSVSRGENGQGLFFILGNSVLVVTGGEALYADMGHFGACPTRLGWFLVVLPGVTLSYLGQGALLIREPSAVYSPFYLQFPRQFLIPMVILATMATVIASQAVIAGCFSMISQAMKLGFLPRMDIHHTSADRRGQIYIPLVNFVLMVSVASVTAGFGSSSELTSAFGMSVTMTMTFDGLLTFFVVSRWLWKKGWATPLAPTLVVMGGLLVLDMLLVASCSLKFLQGAWLPLFIAVMLFIIMTTWRRGDDLLSLAILTDRPPLEPFVRWLADEKIRRTERTGVYMVSDMLTVPQALLHNLKHSRAMHRTTLFVSVLFHDEPRVPPDAQVELTRLADGFWRVVVSYGFMDHPDIPRAIGRLRATGLPVDPELVSYYLSAAIVVPRPSSVVAACSRADMAMWRKGLFSLIHRNAGNAVEYYRLPDDAVTLGSRVCI